MPQRKFTAEIRRNCSGAGFETILTEVAPPADVQGFRQEVLDAIHDLKSTIEDIRMYPTAASISVEPSVNNACDGAESIDLRRELHALERAINQTKQEIAALRRMGKPPETLATATDELDAVVEATEQATECILASSERIDEIVTAMRTRASHADDQASFEDIGEQVTRIFESCNFQDITGQRINKVVGAMKYIEERVERMIEILGGSAAFAALEQQQAKEPENSVDDESHLLCGPQLDQHKISQDDIDAFFN